MLNLSVITIGLALALIGNVLLGSIVILIGLAIVVGEAVVERFKEEADLL